MNDDEKICPLCAETIKKAALICRYCRHEFEQPVEEEQFGSDEEAETAEAQPLVTESTSDEAQGQGVWVLLWISAGLLVLIVASIVLTSTEAPDDALPANETFSDNLVVNDLSAIDNLSVADTEPVLPPDPPTWNYNSSGDDLRGETIYRASIDSSNSAIFDFPYEGGSTLTMTVRRHPEYGEDVIFTISKGQFLCLHDDCDGMINFGSGAEYLSLSESEDNSSDTLFASNGEWVIEKLKKSGKVIIELPFYQEGNRQFTFETKGLVWPPKGAPKGKPAEDEGYEGEGD